MTKSQRRELHAAINALTHDEVAAIVKKEFPRANGHRIDELAKRAIAEAHRIVSSRAK